MNDQVAVIGAGVAGMTAATALAEQQIRVVLIEKEPAAGGHVKNWDRLFPNRRPGQEVTGFLQHQLHPDIRVLTGIHAEAVSRTPAGFSIRLSDHRNLDVPCIILATGYDLFDAARKEEYGYGIYDNVITSADLERMFRTGGSPVLRNGQNPRRVAFIHCVGSRDEKAGNLHCSKVCCVTGVKQAIEVREALPACEVFSFYMDLRMYDRHFEELYLEAQQKWGVNFIRGRLSECAEEKDHRIVVKTEDTLTGRPMKLTVDMVVLLVGIIPSKSNRELITMLGIPSGADGFPDTADEHLLDNDTIIPGIFLSGTVKGPACIQDTVADARAAAGRAERYLKAIGSLKS